MTAASFRLYRRESTDENRMFWGWVQSEIKSYPPPAEVLELLDGASATTIGKDRLAVVVEWAEGHAGWASERRPLYARRAGDDGLGPELDLANPASW